jgi:Family of unknown function (DUF6086)
VSQYYELGEVALWNPSNGVSRLFLRQAALFEEEVGLPSGIGPMRNDEAQISPEVLKAFVHALLVWRGRTRHGVVPALSDGFLATVLVLADRAGIVVERPDRSSGDTPERRDVQFGPGAVSAIDPGGWEARVRDQARELAGFMPR